MKKPILSEEFRRMQKIAGIITEEQYMNEDQGIEQFEDYIDGMWEASISDEMEDGEYYEGVWEKSEYSDEENYPLADQFNGLSKYLSSVGGKATSEGNPDIDLELMPNGDIKFGATVTLDESLDENISGNSSSLPIKETLNMLSDLFGKITDIDIYRLSQPEQQALADLITMCETFTNEYLEDVRNLG
jgi:hypothetical protein